MFIHIGINLDISQGTVHYIGLSLDINQNVRQDMNAI